MITDMLYPFSMNPAKIKSKNSPRAILVHGMGRSPISMMFLAARLYKGGLSPSLFGYSATFERWEPCQKRLTRYIDCRAADSPYILVGHSLGCVLIRSVLLHLARPPAACFFLAPPAKACRAARYFAPRRLYRCVTGEMGQRLADPGFMDTLPLPSMPAKIYAGTGGWRGRWAPLGDTPNDGMLMTSETNISSIPVQEIHTIHPYIMNAKEVVCDILRMTHEVLRHE